MKIKDFFRKETKLQAQDTTITLRDKLGSEEAKKIILELAQQTQALTKKKIADWRTAMQLAINIEDPQRGQLYSIYSDTVLDLHLIGAMRNRKLSVLKKKFYIADKDGNKDDELTKLLQNRWFRQLINIALDSIFWGHSVIQFGDISRTPKLKFKECTLVPRMHVCPEFRTLKKDPGDEGAKGIKYDQPPYNIWAIEFGDNYDLGLLNAITKEAISKKYALQFWDQFAEIFGMPIRIGKTSSRDKKDLIRIETMLDNMGSAPWGLFPDGTTLEIIQTSQGDAFNVYDRRIDRANSEISKAVLGQTMTMDNGSSQSQAQVHEDVLDTVTEADAASILDFCNEDLIPFLLMHGWPISIDHQIMIDDSYQFSPKEMKEIEDMLLTHYDIDEKYFIENYNIPITGKKQVQQPTQLSRGFFD